MSKRMTLWKRLLLGTILIALGIGLLFYCVKSFKDYNYKKKTYIETVSYVYDYDFKNLGKEAAIIVRYEVDGITYHAVSASYSNHPEIIGTPVIIRYNPNNPQDIIWDSNPVSYVLFGVLSGVFIIAGAASYFYKGNKHVKVR